MMVTCEKCNGKYERDNIGDYGYPYLCYDCYTELGYIDNCGRYMTI